MAIIEKNNVVIVCLIPLRLFINVRDNWAVMIKINGVIIEFARDEVSQNVNCIIMIKNIFIIINILIDGLIELNLHGSNEEKISGIIQNMDYPFITLKVISLFNLMFCDYVLSKLSHDEDSTGFII